jgi:hypothetical protein
MASYDKTGKAHRLRLAVRNRALSPLPPYGLTQTVWARSLSVNVLQSGEAVTVSPGPQHPLGAIFHVEGLPAIGNIVVVQVPLVI